MTERTTGQTIAIDNISMAAFLICRNVSLIRVERSGRMGTFHFPASAHALVTEFLTGNALVEPGRFMNAIRELKREVDEARPITRPMGGGGING